MNNDRVFIIAEAGVNHNADMDIARKLIDAAAECGADSVKFQTWKTELLVTKGSPTADYQSENTGIDQSQFELLKSLEVSYDDFRDLKEYCDSKNIIFMSTPDEIVSATFLNELQDIFKIGSGELTNLHYLKQVAAFGKDVILSSGMGTLAEVEAAVNAMMDAGLPREKIMVLHAVTSYPAPSEESNLLAMCAIRDKLGVRVGFSDHTLGINAAPAAVALGARVIEKHFTLDKNMPGPDHKASLEPDEFKKMVEAIREVESALGSGIKEPSPSEKGNIPIVRKSLVAAVNISKGEIFTEDNICGKRPGTGISAAKWDEVIGRKAVRDFAENEFIDLGDDD